MSDEALTVSRRVVIPAADLSWTAVRASGPGGQHVNRAATKVALRFDLPGTAALPPPVKARLRRLARGRFDADGCLVITSQRTREQTRNLADAREKLAELIREALIPPKPRIPTRPSKGAKARRVDEKKKHGAKKQQRGRFKED
jgi:ribosome-associated protein